MSASCPELFMRRAANTLQQYFEIRSKKIAALQASQDPNPYPHKFHTNYRIADYVRDYSHLKKGETEPEKEIRMGLRVMTKRSASSALHFYVCTYMRQAIACRSDCVQARQRVLPFRSCANFKSPRPTCPLKSSMRTFSVEILLVLLVSLAEQALRRVARVS
jgi:hypothetical protein